MKELSSKGGVLSTVLSADCLGASAFVLSFGALLLGIIAIATSGIDGNDSKTIQTTRDGVAHWDVIIVGSGPGATGALTALAQDNVYQHKKILILERGEECDVVENLEDSKFACKNKGAGEDALTGAQTITATGRVSEDGHGWVDPNVTYGLGTLNHGLYIQDWKYLEDRLPELLEPFKKLNETYNWVKISDALAGTMLRFDNALAERWSTWYAATGNWLNVPNEDPTSNPTWYTKDRRFDVRKNAIVKLCPTCDLMTNANVEKVLWKDTKATTLTAEGVLLSDGRRFYADKILVAAGAYNTPPLMQRSGLGPASLYEECAGSLGPMIKDMETGMHGRDHFALPALAAYMLKPNESVPAYFEMMSKLGYTGDYATQVYATPVSQEEAVMFGGIPPDANIKMIFGAVAHGSKTASKSTVLAKCDDPMGAPRVTFNRDAWDSRDEEVQFYTDILEAFGVVEESLVEAANGTRMSSTMVEKIGHNSNPYGFPMEQLLPEGATHTLVPLNYVTYEPLLDCFDSIQNMEACWKNNSINIFHLQSTMKAAVDDNYKVLHTSNVWVSDLSVHKKDHTIPHSCQSEAMAYGYVAAVNAMGGTTPAPAPSSPLNMKTTSNSTHTRPFGRPWWG